MRACIVTNTAVVALLLSGCCQDPLGRERELTVRMIGDLEDECSNLALIADSSDELATTVGSYRATLGAQADKLESIDGCTPCAEALRGVLDSAPATVAAEAPVEPEYPAPPAVEDGVDALEERKGSVMEYRDALRSLAESKDSWERELETLAGSHAIWEGDACAPSPCREVKDTCTADGC